MAVKPQPLLMKLIKIVLASLFLTKAVNCTNTVSEILSNDRHGAAESVFAARTIDDAMYDDIIKSNNEADVSKYFNKLGKDAVSIHAPSILLKAISKGNKVAVNTLISLGADPFKTHKMYNMTAWDFLSVIPDAELSTTQKEIKAELQRRYMNRPEMSRTLAAINQMKDNKLLCFARFTDIQTYSKIIAPFNFPTVYKLSFADGSSPLMQTIIGNNFKLFSSFVSSPGLHINYLWEKKKLAIDIKEIMNIDPIGWSSLMVAVEFNRVEMIKKLLESSNINLNIMAGNVDVFVLARRLPEAKREIILPLLKAKLRNLPTPTAYASFADLKDAIVKGAASNCLTFHLNKGTMNADTFLAAVTNVTDMAIFNEILAEAEKLIRSNRGIHKQIWTALKADVKSGTMEKYKEKIAKLVSRGFKFEERLFHVDNSGGKTPIEESLTDANVKHELALAAILNSTNINVLEGRSAPIVLAVKNDRAIIVKYLLSNAAALGLNFDVMCNEEKENLLHFAITWIKDEAVLIEIIDILLRLKPGFLNSQSTTLVENAVSYKLNRFDVRYSMIKRSRWTPVMYAVMMRKNTVAKHLISKGADKNIKGLDNISVEEIIQKRCRAFTYASQLGGTSDALGGGGGGDDNGIEVTFEVDNTKKAFIATARDRIVDAIKVELSSKFAY